MPMLGWMDRKTGKLYDQLAITRVEYTGDLVAIYQEQKTGKVIVVRYPFEIIEINGEEVTRFCMWGIASPGNDDGF